MVTKSSLQGNVGMDADQPAAPPFSHGPYNQDQDMEFKALLSCSGHFGLNPNRYLLVEYFEQLPQSNGTIDGAWTTEAVRLVNKHFELKGTGASDDDVTFSTTEAGLLLTTDPGANQQVIILPHLDTNQTAWTGILWGNENQVVWEAVVRTGASIASVIIWAGLKLTEVNAVATDDDQAYFRFDGNVANWEATYTVGDAEDFELDTGVTVVASTTYYFRIEIDSSRIPHFFINGVEVATGTALTDDIDLIPYIGVDGSSKTLTVVSTAISRIIFENP